MIQLYYSSKSKEIQVFNVHQRKGIFFVLITWLNLLIIFIEFNRRKTKL